MTIIKHDTYAHTTNQALDAVFALYPNITCSELKQLAIACLDQAGLSQDKQERVQIIIESWSGNHGG